MRISRTSTHCVRSNDATGRTHTPLVNVRSIKHVLDEAGAVLGVQVGLKFAPGEIIIPEETADHLCRIAVDAVTVAARKNDCGTVDVSLTVEDGVLRLTIAGDGDGLWVAAEQASREATQMIAYRVRLLGGTLRNEPGVRFGTRTCITLRISRAA